MKRRIGKRTFALFACAWLCFALPQAGLGCSPIGITCNAEIPRHDAGKASSIVIAYLERFVPPDTGLYQVRSVLKGNDLRMGQKFTMPTHNPPSKKPLDKLHSKGFVRAGSCNGEDFFPKLRGSYLILLDHIEHSKSSIPHAIQQCDSSAELQRGDSNLMDYIYHEILLKEDKQ